MSYFVYGRGQRSEISFPLGGIGTGSIGLSGSGRLIDWEIGNRPSKGSVNGFTHFALRAEVDGEVVDTRTLAGPFEGRLSGDIQAEPFRQFGFGVRREYLSGLPVFGTCEFEGFFPRANLKLSDPKFPGAVSMAAWNPFVPGDELASGLPVAMFELSVTNTLGKPIDYTLAGALASIDGKMQQPSLIAPSAGRTTMLFSSPDEEGHPEFGVTQLGLTMLTEETSWQHHWYRGAWFDSLLVYWKDLVGGGRLKDRHYSSDPSAPAFNGPPQDHCTLAAHFRIDPGQTKAIRYFISWYAPNFQKYWSSSLILEEVKDVVTHWRNYYAVRWNNLIEVIDHCAENWEALTSATIAFTEALKNTDLPLPLLDAVSANLSILKSPTVYRLEDGTLYGFEGCHVDAGSCEGSCSHVWTYQQALPFMFGRLQRGMRNADFKYNQNPRTGGLAFRLPLPLGVGRNLGRPAVDGHFGSVLQTFRDWRLSGDDDWLLSMWPSVKKAIEFAWHPNNYDRWDPDQTGVLWGRQHHTLDMELFGPNSWLTSFYLAALLAGAEMAGHVGDGEASKLFAQIFERGKQWADDHLFDGRHFIQRIKLSDRTLLQRFADGNRKNAIFDGSIYDLYWSAEHQQIKYQIGNGSIIDQVLGQWHATLYGLGEVFSPEKVKKALINTFEANFVEDLGDLNNPCRVFGARGESGTVICSWPEGSSEPAIPIPYAQETQHGYEYAFGSALLQVGELERGIRVFRAVRDRYRGGNRNPWNEIECGSNYARSMASYAALPIVSGFSFDLSRGRIGFAPKLQNQGSFRTFWSTGSVWGEAIFRPGVFKISVLSGSITLREISIGFAFASQPTVRTTGGLTLPTNVTSSDYCSFASTELTAGDHLQIEDESIDLSGLAELHMLN